MRKYLMIIIPLILPTIMYLSYVAAAKYYAKKNGKDIKNYTPKWSFVVTFGLGLIFLALSLFYFSSTGVVQNNGTYDQPRYISPTAPPPPPPNQPPAP